MAGILEGELTLATANLSHPLYGTPHVKTFITF